MSRSDNLVVLPALSVTLFPSSVFVGNHSVVAREGTLLLGEEHQSIEKMTHPCLSLMGVVSHHNHIRIATASQFLVATEALAPEGATNLDSDLMNPYDTAIAAAASTT